MELLLSARNMRMSYLRMDGVFYVAEKPGIYLENFVVESWAEHTRQHDRFTIADTKFEERVLSLVLESPKTRHFLYASRVEHHLDGNRELGQQGYVQRPDRSHP